MSESRMTARERAYIRRLELENEQLRAQHLRHIDVYREQSLELIGCEEVLLPSGATELRGISTTTLSVEEFGGYMLRIEQ